MDGDLSPHQRVLTGESSLSQQLSLRLDVHLVLISELFIQVGRNIEQASIRSRLSLNIEMMICQKKKQLQTNADVLKLSMTHLGQGSQMWRNIVLHCHGVSLDTWIMTPASSPQIHHTLSVLTS